MNINNKVYDKMAKYWWEGDACGTLSTLRYFGNEVRFDYFNSVLKNISFQDNYEIKVLDIGCGGGFLSEEFAKKGFQVTGIDPSGESILVAQNHAKDNNLDIKYYQGFGENLPFESNTFSIITCCDVLEHVSDLKKVIQEISRVLVPGGILFYDTVNRTFAGKLMIKLTQEWKSTSFMEPDVHVWNMFIKPDELSELFKINNLVNKDIKGMSPSVGFISVFMAFRKCKKGKLSFEELGKRLKMHIIKNTLGSYIGYAVKLL